MIMVDNNSKAKTLLLLAGFSVGALVGVNIGSDSLLTSNTYPLDISRSEGHTHMKFDVFRNPPQVEIDLIKESAGKYMIHIETEDFTFTPQQTGGEHVAGEGHAHVYVNNVKISRAYGPWYDLPPLKPGEHKIRVTLNTNDHKEYATHGDIIADEEVITVSTSSEMLVD